MIRKAPISTGAVRTAAICTAASAVLLLPPLLSPALAAADDDSPSAKELSEQAKDNLLKTDSVHLKLTDRGADAKGSRTQPTSMDLSLDRDGNCVGTMRMGSGGGTLELVKRGKEVWMKPDTAFWKAQVPGSQGDAVAELFKNRYIHGSTKDTMLKGLSDTCDLTAFQKEVDTGSSTDAPLTKGAETKIDGTKVIPLKGTRDGKQAVLYVTSAAPHRLVEATEKGGGTDMTLTFTDYGKPVPSATPAPDETVDIGKLQQELRNV
ncbi:hypothetical protein [Streptomyces pseudovenezuelae]|uniref:Lipoprotein n=1 Tax=Streptomyces pseudovenezuelae TaxID=67350 RepID=A0ABT6LM85_9ACTN|nr:hypothetical protein [Streptomyces pseudovenezuelae]MDH6217418.1 hypothetical protein [Streptomyces pseudovenezuelae]